MYGDRDDPAGVLARLGRRMQAVMLPDDVCRRWWRPSGRPCGCRTSPSTSRVDVRSDRGVLHLSVRRVDPHSPSAAAEFGTPPAVRHTEPLTHYGGRWVGCGCPTGVRTTRWNQPTSSLLASLAAEVGPAVQAVRLHQDLLRSRAEVVALREDERRRLVAICTTVWVRRWPPSG